MSDAALIEELTRRLDRLEARNGILEARNSELEAKQSAALRENQQLRERIVVLEHRIQAMARRQFGQSSERIDAAGQQRLDLGLTLPPGVVEDPEDDPPPGGGGGGGRRSGKKRGGRMRLPDHLPVEERIVDLPPEARADVHGPLVVLEERISDKLDYLPGFFRILRHRVRVYGRPWDETTPRVSGRVPGIVAGGLPSDALVAHVLVAKYADHLPHYRLEQQFTRIGLPISRATIGNWSAAAATALKPIADAIGAAVLTRSHLHLDDTTIRVLQPGSGRTHTGRIWIYAHGADAFYDYTETRAGRWCRERLAGFTGHVVCDDYAGHNQLFTLGEAIEVNCWAHARRHLVDSGDTRWTPRLLAQIGELYDIERAIAGRPPDERRDARQRRSRPLLGRLHADLTEFEPQTLPRSAIGLAVRYCLRLWDGLTAYCDDDRLPIDNNDAERGMRRVAMQRKNSLFVGSPEHGANAAICFSIIESCRRSRLDPQAYLVDIFAALQAGRTDYDALRPAAIAETRQSRSA